MTFHTHPESQGDVEFASGQEALTYGSGDADASSGEPVQHNSDTLWLAIGLLIVGVVAVSLPALASAMRARRKRMDEKLPVVKGVAVSAVEKAPLLRVPVFVSTWNWNFKA